MVNSRLQSALADGFAEHFTQFKLLNAIGFFIVWLAIWLPIGWFLASRLQWQPFQPATAQQKLPLVLSLYAIAPLMLGAAAWVEQVPLTDYGIVWQFTSWRSFGVGLGLGAVGVGLLVGLVCQLGWAVWQRQHHAQLMAALLPTFGLGAIVSAIEEPVFRGFLFHHLQQALPLGWAIGLSSLIFALLHLVWDGRASVPQLPGLWLMGGVLLLARWVDGGSLALAWGLHTGWIWAMASCDTAQMLQYRDSQPEWLTGLAGQPLAGAIGLLLLLATGGVLWGIQATGLTT